jgi:hypothetical protein
MGFNNYIVPKIDIEGHICGTYFLYNSQSYEMKEITLKTDGPYKDSFKQSQDDEIMRYSDKYKEYEG